MNSALLHTLRTDLETMNSALDLAALHAATETVDASLAGAGESYIALHREKAISNEMPWARFEQGQIEKRYRAVGRIAAAIRGIVNHRAVGRVKMEEAA